jgi:isopropylmalate/homocitrate/citramalate synthase
VARWVRAATHAGQRSRLSARVLQPHVCEALHSAGVAEAVVEVECGEGFEGSLASASSLARHARAVGLEVRGNVTHAFATGGGDGHNAHLAMVQQAVAALSDSGAYTIVLCDSAAAAQDDTLREAVRSLPRPSTDGFLYGASPGGERRLSVAHMDHVHTVNCSPRPKPRGAGFAYSALGIELR